MNAFEKSKWIWPVADAKADEYAEFYEVVDFYGREAELYISSDSNYTVYVNGSLAAFGQYADFPYSKVYDKIDISRYMRQGKNVVAFRVWYYGIDTTSTYYPGKAGLIYSIISDGVTAAVSSAKTMSRLSPTFVPYKCKGITMQLGLSFEYDSKRADAWMLGEADDRYPFGSSTEIDISCVMRPRTCLRTEFGETHKGREITGKGNTPTSPHGRIFDLGCEAVGFICLRFATESEAPVTVAFGEHLADGHVRQKVGGRDFSFVYHPTRGEINYYMNAFRRFGCRYIELISDEPLTDVEVSLRSVVYPVTDLDSPESLTAIEQKIYDACVYTLKCCMHEHYEDCPWREQALYTMDSRNQMLAGYYAFGERLFPKANLELIAEDNRPDGLLSICYPIKRDFAIPSFSLHFVTECEEYLRYTADDGFIRRIYPKIAATLNTFIDRIDGSGLVKTFSGRDMWNFYEWEDGLDGSLYGVLKEESKEDYDLALNTLLSYAISRMISINERLGLDTDSLKATKSALNTAIHGYFYRPDAALYETRKDSAHFAKLTNALCILAGVADGNLAVQIADRLTTDEALIDASLSMRAFLYDALIEVDRVKYSAYILSDIERIYAPMLKTGNNTVWETELGEADFDSAGSLCHGWSSIPIYYYNLLK
ncbi:MAG: family 78 glycoside hydrolase catalytic domain [Clostridia bacterium]|nr:family 78 glycoside hydrolase catalytic domain [Clostridia bacterium]